MRTRFLFAAAMLLSSTAFAGVRVGEVSSPRADTVAVIRAAAETEVAKLRVDKNAIVSVSLVKLESKTGEITCVVSATLRTESGSVFAILEGRARGNALESAVLRTAVHGALSRIPDAMR